MRLTLTVLLLTACTRSTPAPVPPAVPDAAEVGARAGDAGAATGGAAQGEPCDDGRCAEGLSCLGYYGIAGPRGPRFTSCEIPCGLATAKCPEGQKCVTIADGPGAVCRPE